jgi:hypothetical protein
MSDPHTKSVTISVEEFRRALLKRPEIPQDLLTQALNVTQKKLNAKRTHFFTHKGIVHGAQEVDDHDTQLKAANQIYSLAGVYAREHDPGPGVPLVALEYDSARGVMRLVIGQQNVPNVPMADVNKEVVPYEVTQTGEINDGESRSSEKGASDPIGIGPPLGSDAPRELLPYVPPLRHHPKGDGQWSRLTRPSPPLVGKKENTGKIDGRTLRDESAQERAAFKMLMDEEVDD